MIRSFTPLKKEISTVAVLNTQLGAEEYSEELIEVVSLVIGSSLTGTIINLFVGISKAHPCN